MARTARVLGRAGQGHGCHGRRTAPEPAPPHRGRARKRPATPQRSRGFPAGRVPAEDWPHTAVDLRTTSAGAAPLRLPGQPWRKAGDGGQEAQARRHTRRPPGLDHPGANYAAGPGQSCRGQRGPCWCRLRPGAVACMRCRRDLGEGVGPAPLRHRRTHRRCGARPLVSQAAQVQGGSFREVPTGGAQPWSEWLSDLHAAMGDEAETFDPVAHLEELRG